MDDARRALFSMSNLATRSRYLFGALPKRRKRPVGLQPNSDALHHHERSQTWYRDESSIGKGHTEVKDDQIRDPEQLKSTLTSMASRIASPEISPLDISPVWADKLTTTIASRLGFVYHDKKTYTAGHPHTSSGLFLPGLPHLSPLLSFLSKASPSSSISPIRNIITFLYRHDPSTLAEKQSKRRAARLKWDTEPLPEIKFEFRLASPGTKNTENTEPVLQGAHAVIGDHNFCAALPEKPVDFCITERHTRAIDMGNERVQNRFHPAIKDMKDSIMGQTRLRGPSSMAIPIPALWLAQKAGHHLAKYKSEPLKDTHFKAMYRFVGVEHKQIITFEAGVGQYDFTTVESGKLGPRYMELSTTRPQIEVEAKYEGKLRQRMLKRGFDAGLKMVDLVDKAAKGRLSSRDMQGIEEESDSLEEVADGQAQLDPRNEEPVVEEEHEQDQRAAASG
jgi:hypothetical protein